MVLERLEVELPALTVLGRRIQRPLCGERALLMEWLERIVATVVNLKRAKLSLMLTQAGGPMPPMGDVRVEFEPTKSR